MVTRWLSIYQYEFFLSQKYFYIVDELKKTASNRFFVAVLRNSAVITGYNIAEITEIAGTAVLVNQVRNVTTAF